MFRGDPAAGQQVTSHHRGGLQFAHFLQNHHRHVPGPIGHVRPRGVLRHGSSVLQRQGQVLEAVLGDDGALGQPWPAAIGILVEFLVDEIQHETLFLFVIDRRIDPACRQQRVLATGIQRQNAIHPGRHPGVVEVLEGNADTGLIVVGLQPQHQ